MSAEVSEHGILPAGGAAADELTLFLLTKTPPRLRAASRCRQVRHAGPEHARRTTRCSRGVWGDGHILSGKGNEYYGYCSRCWHEWAAFHSPYTTFQANPASLLNTGNVNTLRFGDALPEVGSERPWDTFPEEWGA